MKPIIQLDIKALTFPDEREPALKNIILNINEGEFIAITGGAAAGKSVLLHAITSAAPKFYPCTLDRDGEGSRSGCVKHSALPNGRLSGLYDAGAKTRWSIDLGY